MLDVSLTVSVLSRDGGGGADVADSVVLVLPELALETKGYGQVGKEFMVLLIKWECADRLWGSRMPVARPVQLSASDAFVFFTVSFIVDSVSRHVAKRALKLGSRKNR